MSLLEICQKNKDTLLSQWGAAFFAHQSLDSVAVLRTVNDQFQNPVGYTIKAATQLLFSAIIGEDVNPQDVNNSLQELMRIQSIQDLTPSQALLPIRSIKPILQKNLKPNSLPDFIELMDIFDRLDSILLLAFDYYSQDREIIANERVQELKRAQSQILRFAQKHD